MIKEKVLNWLQQFDTFCFLDNHQYHIKPHSQECLAGAGVKTRFLLRPGDTLTQLQQFILLNRNNWLFGHLNYDIKNELEDLKSEHPDNIGFPQIFFFEPSVLIRLNENQIIIEADDPDRIFKEITKESLYLQAEKILTGTIKIINRIEKDEYLYTIKKLKEHILRGDCYEINFCQEFFAEQVTIDPLNIYKKLSDISPNPFSALYKLEDKWMIGASPERFLKKAGNKILAQPIKGTSKRVPGNESEDEENRLNLFGSEKDRSENVMVVDLMRNDLSKICKEGTVTVEELYGIYSFPQVHQMISTISGTLKPNTNFSDIIRATFPMGSMTGAPKKKVMELIEQYEKTKRGIFSGTIGYISPYGDFDFNVIIRSILYNDASGYLSFQAGSAITFYSDAEKEWEECLLKAEAMKQVLLYNVNY
ncbi:MAG: anthranilate synthase component I family protein [Chitinophagaceae bacterium]